MKFNRIHPANSRLNYSSQRNYCCFRSHKIQVDPYDRLENPFFGQLRKLANSNKSCHPEESTPLATGIQPKFCELLVKSTVYLRCEEEAVTYVNSFRDLHVKRKLSQAVNTSVKHANSRPSLRHNLFGCYRWPFLCKQS